MAENIDIPPEAVSVALKVMWGLDHELSEEDAREQMEEALRVALPYLRSAQ